MGHAERTASGRYLDDLITLLNRQRDIRDSTQRTDFEIALAVLRDKPFRDGASERTVGLIRAVQVVLALHAMPLGATALQ